jgi:predicted unusual protein kinase regulating ubiquinone biosynthesis (AarF/ABC1/UbiB family)
MASDDHNERDKEANRLTGRLSRYAKVGTGVGSAAARVAAGRAFSSAGNNDMGAEARLFRQALGTLKGPLMKVAQLLATIPEALPAEFAEELAQLQNEAPAMGWPFVRRRMAAELGGDWQSKFGSFEREAAAAASLGQVHRATSLDGRPLACKLQYPDMASAVEADLSQLKMLFALHRQMSRAIDTTEIAGEIGARLREELDYQREAAHMRLYRDVLVERPTIRVPQLELDLCTRRLISMSWLDGRKLLEFKEADEDTRNLLCRHMFDAWWRPFTSHGVIHGDPHLGNYTAWEEDGAVRGLNLLDSAASGCFHRRSSWRGGAVPGLAARGPGPDRARLRDLGLQGAERRADRHSQRLGTVHLWATAERQGDGDFGWLVIGCAVWPQPSVHRAQGAEGKRPGAGAERVRVHGPRGNRAGLGVHSPARADELPSAVSKTRWQAGRWRR